MAYIWKNTILLDGYFAQQETIDACQNGYRLPTCKEFKNMIYNTGYRFDWKKNAGIFTFFDGFELELPAAGFQNVIGSLLDFNYSGCYWSSTHDIRDGCYLCCTCNTIRIIDKAPRDIGLFVCMVRN